MASFYLKIGIKTSVVLTMRVLLVLNVKIQSFSDRTRLVPPHWSPAGFCLLLPFAFLPPWIWRKRSAVTVL